MGLRRGERREDGEDEVAEGVVEVGGEVAEDVEVGGDAGGSRAARTGIRVGSLRRGRAPVVLLLSCLKRAPEQRDFLKQGGHEPSVCTPASNSQSFLVAKRTTGVPS